MLALNHMIVLYESLNQWLLLNQNLVQIKKGPTRNTDTYPVEHGCLLPISLQWHWSMVQCARINDGLISWSVWRTVQERLNHCAPGVLHLQCSTETTYPWPVMLARLQYIHIKSKTMHSLSKLRPCVLNSILWIWSLHIAQRQIGPQCSYNNFIAEVPTN